MTNFVNILWKETYSNIDKSGTMGDFNILLHSFLFPNLSTKNLPLRKKYFFFKLLSNSC